MSTSMGFAAKLRCGFALLLVGLLGGSGCTGGTETGNPSFTGALSYTGFSRAPGATVDNAWLSLDRVTFSGAQSCDEPSDNEFVVPALGVGDHAAGAHNFTRFSTSAGLYCGVQLPFARVADAARLGSAPTELQGRSLLILGHLADGTAFRILSAATPSVALSPTNAGFELSEGEGQLLLAFDFSAWLQDVDFDSAERDADGISISADANPSLLEAFETALPRGVLLYRDRDGDGVIDDDAPLVARGN